MTTETKQTRTKPMRLAKLPRDTVGRISWKRFFRDVKADDLFRMSRIHAKQAARSSYDYGVNLEIREQPDGTSVIRIVSAGKPRPGHSSTSNVVAEAEKRESDWVARLNEAEKNLRQWIEIEDNAKTNAESIMARVRVKIWKGEVSRFKAKLNPLISEKS